MSDEFLSPEQEMVLKAIHDGRPDPAKSFRARSGDGVVKVEPTKALCRQMNAGKSKGGEGKASR